MDREKIRELAHLMIMPQYGKKGCSAFFQLALKISYQRARDYVGKMEEIGILRTFEEAKNKVEINKRLIIKSKNAVNKIIDEYFDTRDEKLKKELIETNEQLKKDNALAELKNWKDKLELELISKEEYDKHKKRLGSIIMKD